MMLIMTGKLRGPLQVNYVSFSDPSGNPISIPWIPAITISLSFLSMLKTCVSVNLQWIHVKEGSNFYTFVERAFAYIPFFASNAFFRFSAISLLMTYTTYWTFIPVTIIFLVNLIYGYTRYEMNKNQNCKTGFTSIEFHLPHYEIP